jgi:predicted transcriptional regulator
MKRERIEIISEMLNICINGACRTQILAQAKIKSKALDTYLDFLIKNNQLETYQGQYVLYKTTEKGINLMNNINRINDSLSGGLYQVNKIELSSRAAARTSI